MKNCIVLLTIFFISACSSGKKVSYSVDTSVDFSLFRSYSFTDFNVHNDSTLLGYEEVLTQITEAIDKEMTKRGFTKAEDNIDLLVNIGVVIEERIQTRETDVKDARRYYGTRNYHWESSEIETGRYKVGTLNMNMQDTKDNKMIWNASTERVMNKKFNPDKSRKVVNDAVESIFEKFPVSVGNKY
jgi:hypothetical protein